MDGEVNLITTESGIAESNVRRISWLNKKIRERGERRRIRSEELIGEYSYIVDQIPEAERELLTISLGNITIGARRSFQIYFKGQVPRENIEIFTAKFIEIYHRRGRDVLRGLNRRGWSRRNSIEDFWKLFSHLFYKNNGNTLRAKFWYAMTIIAKVVKIIRRCLMFF